ncbi:MAG TPA: response regulator transcription factor [Fimbriimonas sp.]|nr:response regulator transcription factor [Fimbriimonas sp.]
MDLFTEAEDLNYTPGARRSDLSNLRVLLVDPDRTRLEVLSDALVREGLRIATSLNLKGGLRLYIEWRPDLVITDALTEEESGLSFCKPQHALNRVPVIVLQANPSEADKILAFDRGADDHLTRPFSTQELVARAKSILRRIEDHPTTTLKVGDIEIDELGHTVCVRGQEINLAPKEFSLLSALMRSPNVVHSRESLLSKVWGRRTDLATDRTLDVHVRWLRSKIEADPACPTTLMTVRGIGYKLVAR